MVELNAEQLRKLQLIELDMICEVDRICRKNHINYTIIGGTLLGAVRHGGFIPWDDDADIAMLREDYEKFAEICKRELEPSKYYFQNYKNTKGYRWGYGKLRRKKTLFVRNEQEHMPYGQEIFIDIFPIDSVPDNNVKRVIHNFLCFCIRKTLWSAIGRKSEKNVLFRQIYKLLFLIPINRVFNVYEKIVQAGSKSNTLLVRTLTFPLPNRACKGYKREWFQKTNDIFFEGKKFRGVKDFDGWLKFEFGDYMTIPDKSKRKIHPVSTIKLL